MGRQRPHGRPRSEWEENKLDPKKTGYEAMARDQWRAFVYTVMNTPVK
jgi:hypothetical protein